MSKANVYNLEANKVAEIELDPQIFDVPMKEEVVHQVVVAQQANARKVLSHAKTRSEKRGGGKKPWRQKGTGRARHGSSRSPLWVGGGVTFGPTKERNFSKKINKKTKAKALAMVLTEKAKNDQFYIVEKLEVPEIKTKKIVELIKNFPIKTKKVLIVISKKDDNIIKSVKNLENIEVIKADSLNIIDILNYQTIFTDQSSVEKIVNTYKK